MGVLSAIFADTWQVPLDIPRIAQGFIEWRCKKQGKPLLRRPASSGGVSATLRQGRATVVATVNHVGPRDDVDFRDFPSTRTALPSYTTVDGSFDIPVRGPGRNFPGLDVTLRAENLFDAAYQQTIGFPGRGRTLLAGVRVRLGVQGER